MSAPALAEQQARPRPSRDGRAGLVLTAPALILIGLFVLLPGVLAVVGSLFRIDLGANTTWSWVGAANFADVLSDPNARQALGNTLLYCLLTIVPSLGVGLGLALLAGSLRRGERLLHTLLFLPFTANLVAMAVVFRWIFALRGGFANQVLAVLGIGPVNYLGDERYALATVAAVGVWRGAALTMVLFAAGLTSIPSAVHEAAAADGIRGWSKLRLLTLPLLRPIVLFATVMMILQSVQVFDTINVMTGGGPLGATETALTMTWRLGFTYFELGKAAALSVLLLAVLITLGVLRRRAFLGDRR
ncbi:putative membrane protein [Candidatus Protofrankia californiensis]|uniref:Putative membrane protein n=1 Tax=Candidatus Protofrankia californiensis TaxID=1839754 RepID=A0A1C3P991_9ACTN|nr:putative membrane protein [Candidatus Protofrankia californiensis]